MVTRTATITDSVGTLVSQGGPRSDLRSPLAVNSLRHYYRLRRELGPQDPDRKSLHRHIVASSVLWSPLRILERLFVDPRVDKVNIEHPPIFILGHWRTGTTHLHNLMSLDPNLAHVTTFQTLAPECCVTGRYTLRPIMALNMPATRPMDNVALGIDLPQEDEFSLCNVTLCSMYNGFYFPRSLDRLFDRYVLFDGISTTEIDEWRTVYTRVLKKATYLARGKRLVLKNPVNTARIPQLLGLFPGAKFIFIHRNPYEIFHSTNKLFRSVIDQVGMQDIPAETIRAHVLRFFREMMTRYIETAPQAPRGDLVEVAYTDLITDPVREVTRIYRELGLSGIEATLPLVKEYASKQQSYEPNRFTLAPDDADLIEREWGFAIEHWGYTRPGAEIISQT
ncbi:MAG: sulfotransferase [Candidatus Hydrogenedentota bacterium]